MSSFLSPSQSLGAITSGIGSLGSAVSAMSTAQGDEDVAAGLEAVSAADTQEAALYGENATLAKQGTAEALATTSIQQYQQQRQLELTQGTTMADAAANGETATGSVAGIIRSNANQGAIMQQLFGLQSAEEETSGTITENSYTAQQESATAAATQAEDNAEAERANAAGAKGAGILSGLSGIGGIVAGLASIL